MTVQSNFPIIKPSLLLDFANVKALDPRITFTRSTTATYYDANGVLQTAASGVARFDHNPTTGESLGLLVEEQRTNLLTYSEEFDNAAWSKTDVTVTANDNVAPDGTLTADLATEGSAGTAILSRGASATVSSGATVTSSVYVKRSATVQWLRANITNSAGTNGGRVWFDIQNGVLGAASNVGSGTATSGTITPVGNNWYRITNTTTLAAGDTTALVSFVSASADSSLTRVSGSAYFIWGAQLEAGAFPTSYIATTSSSVTRNADAASMTGTNFSSWFRADESSLYVDANVPPNLSAFPAVANINDGSSQNQISHYLFTSGYYANVRSGNALQGEISRLTSPVVGDTYKYAVGLILNNAAAAANGLIGVTDTSLLMPVGVNQLRIGANATGGAVSNTTIRKIAYYPSRLSNAQLQALTAS